MNHLTAAAIITILIDGIVAAGNNRDELSRVSASDAWAAGAYRVAELGDPMLAQQFAMAHTFVARALNGAHLMLDEPWRMRRQALMFLEVVRKRVSSRR